MSDMDVSNFNRKDFNYQEYDIVWNLFGFKINVGRFGALFNKERLIIA